MAIQIVAARSDGLGERLNAILNGMYLAERLGYDFRFHWSSSGTWRRLGVDDSHHAIAPREEFFSSEFIDRFEARNFSGNGLVEVSGKNMTRQDFQKREQVAGFKGWAAPRIDLREILCEDLRPGVGLNLSMVFSKIGFSDRILNSISAARDVPLPHNINAFHLRSGDIFYGPYRKLVSFSYKGITLPIAKAMIAKVSERGAPALLFGQDLDVLRYLSSVTGALVAEDLRPAWIQARDEVAMFELLLMSRCSAIVGGSSGFARQASWIGGGIVMQPKDFFSHTEQTRISIEDLAKHSEIYHPLQSAFAYWYAYFYGRQFKSFEEADWLLERAYHYDSENQLYCFKRASNCFRHGKIALGEAHLKRMLGEEARASADFPLPALRILVSKTLRNFNLEEDFPFFEKAADEGGSYAFLCSYVVRQAKGEVVDKEVVLDRVAEVKGLDPDFDILVQRFLGKFPNSLQ